MTKKGGNPTKINFKEYQLCYTYEGTKFKHTYDHVLAMLDATMDDNTYGGHALIRMITKHWSDLKEQNLKPCEIFAQWGSFFEETLNSPEDIDVYFKHLFKTLAFELRRFKETT